MEECFSVNTDLLRQDVKELRQSLECVRELHTKMTDAANTVEKVWNDRAKDLFCTQLQGDCADLMKLHGELSELVESMDSAAREYDACDGKVKEIVGAIRI